ncbi:hybrid sensor histidine kinase/response regulator [Desulfobacter curvatus]|uniref:hybrid sensor histidine kinase/response regulator n=1 Tax=Desulfobacter curvatus TaxID=2290 RepID=UPI00037433FD|nr:PAS domain-containing sensor histidine kinase [Desulfobacter curvatus]
MKQTLSEYKRNAGTYLTLFNYASDAAFVHDIQDWRIREANHIALEMFGYTKDEMLRQDTLSLSEGNPPYSRTEVKARIEEAAGGAPLLFEWRCRKKNGSLFWGEVTLRRISFEDGDLMLVIIRDLTASKKQEETRRDQEIKYKTILQTAVDGYLLSDMEGRILEVNEAYCQMSGYGEKELLLMSIPDLDGRMTSDEIASKILQVKKIGYEHIETRHRRKDGSLYNVEINAKYVSREGGTLVMFIRDITEFRKAEKEKAALHTQLYLVRKLESIGRLAGGVAHDLNNLLLPILGYSEILLEDTKDNASYQAKLKSIIKAGHGARSLINQLLAFSRKQTLEFRLVDVDRILTDFKKLLRRTIREDIRLNIVRSPGRKTIMADQTQLEQIIMNLSVNAADAMPDGGEFTIETGITRLDEAYASKCPGVLPGQYVVMRFTDTGQGMDKETCDKIFEPFYSTKGEQGTGLGLATVYGVVKQHKGNIWVNSEVGKGSVFKVYLPYVSGKRVDSVIKKEAVNKWRGSETILLAEDNEEVRNFVADILNRSGYTVFCAENGNKALEIWACSDESFDLLVTDVIMPEMNGRELFESLHSLDSNIKVLYMSGYPDSAIEHHCILGHDVKYIQKPFDSDDFLSKIRQVLNNKT